MWDCGRAAFGTGLRVRVWVSGLELAFLGFGGGWGWGLMRYSAYVTCSNGR